MARGTFRSRSRQMAFISLLIFSSFIILLGLVVLAVGLAITHHDDFHNSPAMKEQIEPELDYVQYWIGLPYVITGISVACSAVNLRRVTLTACTLTLSIACIVLSLAGLVVDGPDWVKWKNYKSRQRYWEGEDGYACSTKNAKCACVGINTTETITSFTDCETLRDLSSIYGILIASFVFTLAILLACITVIVYVITSKHEQARRAAKGKSAPERRLERTARGASVNPGYEIPKEGVPTSNAEYRNIDVNSMSQHGRDGSTLNGGVVMMDHGHFGLADDEVY